MLFQIKIIVAWIWVALINWKKSNNIGH